MDVQSHPLQSYHPLLETNSTFKTQIILHIQFCNIPSYEC